MRFNYETSGTEGPAKAGHYIEVRLKPDTTPRSG